MEYIHTMNIQKMKNILNVSSKPKEEEKIYPIGHIKNIKQNIDNLVSKIKYSKTINKLINDLNERLNKIEKHKYYCEFIVGNKSYYDYKFLLYDYT